ncbi:MAG TPA: hypothetical protein VLK53_15175 [Gaiellaceae bacterium]|nr:hypothetical protein [Gaiellaceae bacterium]
MAETQQADARHAWSYESAKSAVVAVPVWAWLVVLVAVSTVSRYLLARQVSAPFIFQDELLYSELAKGLGTTGHFALRDVPGLYAIGPVYPALISPAYALFDAIPHAYGAAKAINALLMSLAAVPAYLIARRLVSPWLALLAATLAIAIPDVLLAGTIMTENAFYPVFLLWLWLLVCMLERPTVLNQVAVLATLLVAYETRSQGVVLAPALVTALVLMIAAEARVAGDRRRVLVERARSYWVTWALLAVGALLYVVVEIVIRGQTISSSLLKTYSALGSVNYTVAGVAKWFLYLVGEVDLVVGVLPFAAFLVVVAAAAMRAESTRALRAFAASGVAAVFWIFLVVAAFSSSPYSQRLEERNDFYVMPVLLIALVVWAARFAGRLPRATGLAATTAVALVGILPVTSFLNGNAITDSFGLLTIWRPVIHHGIPAEWITPLLVLIALAVAALFVLLPARLGLVAPALVLLFLAFSNREVQQYLAQAGKDSLNGGIQVQHRNWLDRAVGKGTVTALFTNARPPQTLWQNEFFNHSVGPVYNFAGQLDGLPQATVVPDAKTGVLLVAGATPLSAQYVLTDTSQFLAGKQVAADSGAGMKLYRVDGKVRVIGSMSGIYPDGWSGPTAGFTASDCPGGRLSMRLTGDPDLQPKPQTIVARSGDRVVGRIVVHPRHFHVPFSVPLVSSHNVCSVQFTISPTAVPAEVFNRPDSRELGIRMEDVRYEPSR